MNKIKKKILVVNHEENHKEKIKKNKLVLNQEENPSSKS
jgi:hypothetical protein